MDIVAGMFLLKTLQIHTRLTFRHWIATATLAHRTGDALAVAANDTFEAGAGQVDDLFAVVPGAHELHIGPGGIGAGLTGLHQDRSIGYDVEIEYRFVQ